MKYDIFLSYRRGGGQYISTNIYTILTNKYNRKVYFDVSDYNMGNFMERIEFAVKNSSVFVIIITENSIERMIGNVNDVSRRELEYALKYGLKIFPINTLGETLYSNIYNLPELPECIETLKMMNTKDYVHELQDSLLENLNNEIRNQKKNELYDFYSKAKELASNNINSIYGKVERNKFLTEDNTYFNGTTFDKKPIGYCEIYRNEALITGNIGVGLDLIEDVVMYKETEAFASGELLRMFKKYGKWTVCFDGFKITCNYYNDEPSGYGNILFSNGCSIDGYISGDRIISGTLKFPENDAVYEGTFTSKYSNDDFLTNFNLTGKKYDYSRNIVYSGDFENGCFYKGFIEVKEKNIIIKTTIRKYPGDSKIYDIETGCLIFEGEIDMDTFEPIRGDKFVNGEKIKIGENKDIVNNMNKIFSNAFQDM